MNPSRHILQDFDAGLESLRADVLMMASLTDRNLQHAMACLLDGNIEIRAGAFADEDATLARSIKDRDREIDQINHDITDDFTEKMSLHPERITDYVNLIFIARHLERVGDHAKNIGEEAVYATEAEDIRHRRAEIPDA